MNIAIIPARSKSKRIKNKNIINFLGKPIIYWPIRAAKKSKIFKKIIVSTDSKKISNIANSFGAETPFFRPKRLSGDKTGILAVVQHTIKFLEKKKIKFDNVCCIFSTTPMIDEKILKKTLKKLKKGKFDFVFGATKKNKNILRSFYYKNKKLKMANPEFFKYMSQDLPQIYLDTGQFYWGSKKAWKKSKKIFSSNSSFIELDPDKYIDINSNEDLKKTALIANKKLFN